MRHYPVFLLIAAALPLVSPEAGQPPTPDLLLSTSEDVQWLSKFGGHRLLAPDAEAPAGAEMAYDLSRAPGYDWIRLVLPRGADCRPYRFLSFRVRNPVDGARVIVSLMRRTDRTEANRFGEVTAPAEHRPLVPDVEGWKQVSIPLDAFARLEAVADDVTTVNFSLTGAADASGTLAVSDVRFSRDPAGEIVEEAVRYPPADIAVADDEAFFALLDLDLPALAAVRTAANARDWPAAREAWARHLSERTSPRWVWSRRDRERIVTMLRDRGAGPEKSIPAADTVLRREFDWLGVRKVLNRDIDWLQGPVEWTHVLSRHGYWTSLARAWWATDDPVYAEDWVYMLRDWIADNPVPRLLTNDRGPDGTVWRTLETGIRGDLWFDLMESFMDAPAFDTDAKVRMTASLVEQARHLYRYETAFRAGNWQVVECTGLAVIGMMLPECREAPQWRERAFRYLVEHMERDVYPDGAHHELTPGYHGWVLERFLKVALVAAANGIEVPGLLDRHERMFEFLMHLSRPNRRTFPVGDAGTGSGIGNVMGLGALLYNRADMRFLGPDKAPAGWLWQFPPAKLDAYEAMRSEPPAVASRLLPHARYGVMRTGWDAGDSALLFDAAPWGGGHSHRDRLQVVLYDGRDLLMDPGMYSYDQPLSRTYFRNAAAHNVLLVDEKDQPQSNPRVLSWIETPEVVFASAEIEGNGIRQQRSVLFVKPGYWVVTDHVFGDGEPVLTRLFHFPDVAVDMDETSARTRFPEGRNVWVACADGAAAEAREGWLPSGGADAVRAPVAAFVSSGPLPAALTTVLVPFDREEDLPRIETFDAGAAPAVGIRLHFPDGRTDSIAVSPVPAALRAGPDTAEGVVLWHADGPVKRHAVIPEHRIAE